MISSVLLGHCGLDRGNILDDYEMDLDISKWEQFSDFGSLITFTATDEYIYHVEAF